MIFFNQTSKGLRFMQMLNLGAAAVASFSLLTDPEASCTELGLDILTHALTALSLRDNADPFSFLFNFSVNAGRMGAIYAGTTLHASTIPLPANLIDMLVHGSNLLAALASLGDAPSSDSISQGPK